MNIKWFPYFAPVIVLFICMTYFPEVPAKSAEECDTILATLTKYVGDNNTFINAITLAQVVSLAYEYKRDCMDGDVK